MTNVCWQQVFEASAWKTNIKTPPSKETLTEKYAKQFLIFKRK
jgi:hypothetical protein